MAELAHKKIREWWKFGMSENLENQELIGEKYQGIRPASGYPSQPDHTEKDTIWDLMSVQERIGLELTESCNEPRMFGSAYTSQTLIPVISM